MILVQRKKNPIKCVYFLLLVSYFSTTFYKKILVNITNIIVAKKDNSTIFTFSSVLKLKREKIATQSMRNDNTA